MTRRSCSAISFPWSQVIPSSPATDLVNPAPRPPVRARRSRQPGITSGTPARPEPAGASQTARRFRRRAGRGTEHPAEQPERRTDNLPVQHQVSLRNSWEFILGDIRVYEDHHAARARYTGDHYSFTDMMRGESGQPLSGHQVRPVGADAQAISASITPEASRAAISRAICCRDSGASSDSMR